MDLPRFPYHPDPLATGAIARSPVACTSCGRRRDYVYRGPVFAAEELVDCLCPWCIASGAAAAAFDAVFTDLEEPGVPPSVVERVTRRTPGFSGWQQERWLTHCGDAAAYVGRVGAADLDDDPGTHLIILRELRRRGYDVRQARELVRTLVRDGSPTAHRFRCLHCAAAVAYWDAA
jgi:uncharacterized protein CbrC (UPF0167 family)